MRDLYPEIEPYHSEMLEREALSDQRHHRIYLEQCGNPQGIPVVFLHGGPGSGCRPAHRRYFDPKRYRIILFDQRGCGRSEPLGELENNNTEFLVDDMEAIRQHLGIEKWLVFGGSWGATLALVYAAHFPQTVTGLILRGVFLGRKQDVDWVYAAGGASKLFPDAWHQLVKHLPEQQQDQPLPAYFEALTCDEPAKQQQAALTLNNWEGTIVTLRDHEYVPDPEQQPGPLAHSRIQLHFALNECFIADTPILQSIEAIRHIPTQIVHGRYDIVCPMQQSWELKQHWPEAELQILPLAGHAAGEAAMIDALVAATDAFAEKLA
jgi:proline iminopeptidase